MLLTSVQEKSLDKIRQDSEKEHYEMIRQIHEEKVSHWKPGKDYWLKPPATEIAKGVHFSGIWSTGVGFSSASLTFTSLAEYGKYSVVFATGGCLSSWSMDRSATYKNGVLTFNKPVEEYASDIYQHMYAVSYPGGIRLVPAPEVKRAWETVDGKKAPRGGRSRGFVPYVPGKDQ